MCCNGTENCLVTRRAARTGHTDAVIRETDWAATVVSHFA